MTNTIFVRLRTLGVLRALLAVAGLACALPAAACINAFGTDRDGRSFVADYETGKNLEHLLTCDPESSYFFSNAKSIAAQAKATPTFEKLTNLGVVLIYQHKYRAAIQHFLRLESVFPGRAETAANLGTALELSDRDESALKWIELGIARNREEHFGTEWLHARILKAKIAAASGHWNHDASIAGLTFADMEIPPLPERLPSGNDGKPVEPWALDLALLYQLRERLQFVSAPDWVVADLMSDWATLNLAGGPVENAKVQYGLAVRYGAEETPLMVRRRARIDRILSTKKVSRGHEAIAPRCEICQH